MDIGFRFHNIDDTSKSDFEIDKVSLMIDNFKVDTSHFDFRTQRLANEIVLKLHDRKLITADSLYELKTNNISYYYSKNSVVVDSFEMRPRYESEEFFRKAKYQTSIFFKKILK